MAKGPQNSFEWLAGEFSARLAQVLESMTGEKSVIQWTSAHTSAESEAVLWWEHAFTVPAGARVWVAASEGVWRAIGGGILEAAGIQAEIEDARGTYLETLSQVLSAVSQSLGAKLRREVSGLTSRVLEDAPPASSQTAAMMLPSGQLVVSFSDELIATLDKPATQEISAAGASAGFVTSAYSSTPGPKTLDLLLDVEMPVSISFGRAQLALKDVIKLTSGSIVDLNRSVTEPVEIIVNNCVIARGEVVVVEGNYGVRIKQIISPQERLRTLK